MCERPADDGSRTHHAVERPGEPRRADGVDRRCTGGDEPGRTADGVDRRRADGGTWRRRRAISRRGLLVATGVAVGLSTPVVGETDVADSAGEEPPLHVRVYAGPTPLHARLRSGVSGVRTGWTEVHEAAIDAVEDALGQIADYAAEHTDLGAFEYRVERHDPVGSRLGLASPLDALTPATTIYDRFRDVVHERDLVTGRCCHLLLWWDGLNYDVGYGGTRSPNSHVARVDGEGSQTVANVGATEFWDSRAVTRNIAIHETLHTFLSSSIVETVIDSRCDHDLGTAVAVADGVREVSPMATAYAGPEGIGGGTRFHGTGCFDHDAFSRHDGIEGVDRWRYTTELSDATLEAVTRYVERYLLD